MVENVCRDLLPKVLEDPCESATFMPSRSATPMRIQDKAATVLTPLQKMVSVIYREVTYPELRLGEPETSTSLLVP